MSSLKIGKYDILEVLGKGGMGVVYRAYDPVLDREVALKTIMAEGLKDPVLRERFYREARAAGKLRHPNIVTIYDLGEENNVPYFAMEYVHGTDIHNIIRSRENITMDLKIRIILQLCRGLAYAHRAGIIHRDIKPSNVRLTDDYQVKIVDFGIARLVTSQTMTTNGTVMGTIHYMSPEQIKATHVDKRSDIFSAGIIFYELLIYRKPFEADNPAGVLYKIAHEAANKMDPPLDEQFPMIKRVLGKSLERDPGKRYYSADEMADDLESFLRSIDPLQKIGTAPTVEYPAITIPPETATPGEIEKEPPPSSVPYNTDPRALDLIRTAKRFLVEGRSVQAVSKLRQALQIDAQSPEAIQLLQVVEQDFKKTETEDLLKRGQEYLKEGQYEIALKAFEKILKINPNHSKARILLEALKSEMPEVDELITNAKNAYTEKKYQLATKYVEEVLKIFPKHREAQEILVVLKERLSNEEFTELLQAGERFIQDQEFETAVKAFEKALKILPKHPVALQRSEEAKKAANLAQVGQLERIGKKQIELENYEDACQTFGRILEIDPNNESARVIMNRIDLRLKEGQVKQLLNMGWRALMMDREYEEVIRIGERILGLDPKNAEALSLITAARKELH